ncbi:MAG: hypothetical protein ABIR65_01220 [Pseudolysinimonas sp.]
MRIDVRHPDASDIPAPSLADALEWARSADAGEYLVHYVDAGSTSTSDPGSRCGYDDAQLDAIGRTLAERDLQLVTDDRGLLADARRS